MFNFLHTGKKKKKERVKKIVIKKESTNKVLPLPPTPAGA